MIFSFDIDPPTNKHLQQVVEILRLIIMEDRSGSQCNLIEFVQNSPDRLRGDNAVPQKREPVPSGQAPVTAYAFSWAAFRVFLISMAMVMGPTPPGTGVI